MPLVTRLIAPLTLTSLVLIVLALLSPRPAFDPLAGVPVPGTAWTTYHDCYYVPMAADSWWCHGDFGTVAVSNGRVRRATLVNVDAMLLELRYAYGAEDTLVRVNSAWRASWSDWLTAWVDTNHPQARVVRVWLRARG